MLRPSRRHRTSSRASNARGEEAFCGTGPEAAVAFEVPSLLLHDYYKEKKRSEKNNLWSVYKQQIETENIANLPRGWIDAGVVACRDNFGLSIRIFGNRLQGCNDESNNTIEIQDHFYR